IEVIIEAAKLLQADPGYHLLFQLIGDGAKRTKLEVMVAEYDLPNVHFLPYQSMDDLAAMLSAADLAIVCLEPEFTGLSVPSKSYGVMACGIPILGLLDPQGEIAQTIAEADCGVILAQPTGENVAQAILDLMANPVRRSQMGANGRNAFLTRYTLGQAAQAYDQALTQMVTLQKSRPQTRFALHESGANGQLESKSH
ncbi:MAG: glycosyltransferase, partial [Caldilineaceae bacterium]|nr:glycosyltransferase [Caldilineaceae bacterium]